MGIESHCFADCVDFGSHDWASTMVSGRCSAGLSVSEGGMMHGDNDRAGIVCFFDVGELGGEVLQLIVGNSLPLAALAGNNAGIFQGVTEESDDPDKRGIKGKIDPRLHHGGTMERASFGCGNQGGGAKVTLENFKRCLSLRSIGQDERVVITRYGENGPWIITVGLVELVVVVSRFSKVINQIAKVE